MRRFLARIRCEASARLFRRHSMSSERKLIEIAAYSANVR
jgi:hypothetical protein